MVQHRFCSHLSRLDYRHRRNERWFGRCFLYRGSQSEVFLMRFWTWWWFYRFWGIFIVLSLVCFLHSEFCYRFCLSFFIPFWVWSIGRIYSRGVFWRWRWTFERVWRCSLKFYECTECRQCGIVWNDWEYLARILFSGQFQLKAHWNQKPSYDWGRSSNLCEH